MEYMEHVPHTNFFHTARDAAAYARDETRRTKRRHVVVPTDAYRINAAGDPITIHGLTVVLHTKAFARSEKAKALAGEKAILERDAKRKSS